MSPTLRDALSGFCATSPEIDTAYVCRVERIWPDARTDQRLSFIVKLTQPIREPDDAQSEQRAVCDRFIRQHPELARELGVGVLADRAVPAWDKNAQKVYERSPL